MDLGQHRLRDHEPVAWGFHRATARWQFNASSSGSQPLTPGREDPDAPFLALPPPAPLPGALSEAVAARASCRAFSDAALSLGELATLLTAGYGVAGRSAADGYTMDDRPVPSGGGLYPLELSLLVRRVDGLAPGVHHYVPAVHGLEQLRAVDLPEAFVTYLFMGQHWVARAAVVVVVSFVPGRSLVKYGERGYRYALLEAGHLMQNLNLATAALGLGAVNLGGFYDDELAGLLRIDPEAEVCLYACACGRPAHPGDRMASRALGEGT
jgi:SagB-type dehydrogenase family enzyme